VSNFRPNRFLLPHAEIVSALVDKKIYVTENGRNGLDPVPDSQIYDPNWAAWGGASTTLTGMFFPHWAAALNIKRIGEPDKGGWCGTDYWCSGLALPIMENWARLNPQFAPQ
jgi:hypothetical protein